MRLVMGVVDFPYAYDREQIGKSGKVLKKKAKVKLSITTGEVASILEANYSPMESYFILHKKEIAEWLAESAMAAFRQQHITGSVTDPSTKAMGLIEDGFKKFLSTREFESVPVPSLRSAHSSRRVPTQAALDGVNHRLAHPYAKSNPRRPSLIDTGLYQSAFKAWID